MSQPAVTRETTDEGTAGETTTGDDDAEALLDALDDADCRAILDATGDTALSASEVADACDLPLSTTYRKLDGLTRVGLLEERTRVRRSGTHASEYRRRVDEVTVALDDGVTVRTARRRE